MLHRHAEIIRQKHRVRAVLENQYKNYETALSRQSMRIQQIDGDGNCLFRSVSHQVYGDDSYHAIVRAKCMEYMEVEKAYFQDFVVGNEAGFMNYVSVFSGLNALCKQTCGSGNTHSSSVSGMMEL